MLDDTAPVVLLCQRCGRNPRQQTQKLCHICQAEVNYISKLRRQALQSAYGTGNLKPSLHDEDKPHKPYEVSFIAASGIRLGRKFETEYSAHIFFEVCKRQDMCGLLLEKSERGKQMKIDSHQGSRRPALY